MKSGTEQSVRVDSSPPLHHTSLFTLPRLKIYLPISRTVCVCERVSLLCYSPASAFQDKESEGTEEVLGPSTKVHTHAHAHTTYRPSACTIAKGSVLITWSQWVTKMCL